MSISLPDDFEAFRQKFTRPLYGYLRGNGAAPEMAEEIVNDALYAVARHWAKLSSPDNRPDSYLYTAARNELIKRQEKASRYPLSSSHDEHERAVEFESALVEDAAIIDVYNQLPVSEREAIKLRYIENFDTAETAKIMGISKGTVKSYVSRGMAKLNVVMEQGCDAAEEATNDGQG